GDEGFSPSVRQQTRSETTDRGMPVRFDRKRNRPTGARCVKPAGTKSQVQGRIDRGLEWRTRRAGASSPCGTDRGSVPSRAAPEAGRSRPRRRAPSPVRLTDSEGRGGEGEASATHILCCPVGGGAGEPSDQLRTGMKRTVVNGLRSCPRTGEPSLLAPQSAA